MNRLFTFFAFLICNLFIEFNIFISFYILLLQANHFPSTKKLPQNIKDVITFLAGSPPLFPINWTYPMPATNLLRTSDVSRCLHAWQATPFLAPLWLNFALQYILGNHWHWLCRGTALPIGRCKLLRLSPHIVYPLLCLTPLVPFIVFQLFFGHTPVIAVFAISTTWG